MFDFLGQFEHTLDDKGRLIIPSSYRDDLQEGLVITRGKRCYLNMFPLPKWAGLIKDLEALPVYTQTRSANLRRMVLAHAVKTRPDSHGRVRIPDHLREYAKIGDQVVLAGVGDHVELWSPTLWLDTLHELDSMTFEDDQQDLLRI